VHSRPDTDNPEFAAEPWTQQDAEAWSKSLSREASKVLERLANLPRTAANSRLLARRADILLRLFGVDHMRLSACKTRVHGDYHSGQVLVSRGDVFIIDFEGEPMRSLGERRSKQLPLRDVAGMLRSFDYLVEASRRAGNSGAPDGLLPEMWSAFLSSYQSGIAGTPSFPVDPKQAGEVLLIYLLEKSIYEIGYELSNRPDWVEIPIRSFLRLIEEPVVTFE